MKRKLKRSHIIILAVVVLSLISFMVIPQILGVDSTTDPHAGHNHGSEVTDEHAGHDHADTNTNTNTNTNSGHKHTAAHNKSAKDSYAMTKRENGTYSFTVTARSGHVYDCPSLFMSEPIVSVISNDVILVSGKYGRNNDLSGWAYYYNVVGEGKVGSFGNFVLAATANKVAYLDDSSSDPFRVVVCDPFDTSKATYTELPGLEISDSGSPKVDCKMLDNGDLQVTYIVDGANKSVTIKMG